MATKLEAGVLVGGADDGLVISVGPDQCRFVVRHESAKKILDYTYARELPISNRFHLIGVERLDRHGQMLKRLWKGKTGVWHDITEGVAK